MARIRRSLGRHRAFVGTKQIDQNDANVGEAHRADQILLDAGFQIDPQTEFVLIQSKTKTIEDPAFKRVVEDTIVAVQPHGAVFSGLKSPLDPSHRTQVSNDGHTALVEFTMKGTDDQAKKVIDPIVKSTDGVRSEASRLLRGRGRLDLDRQGARQDVQLAARAGRLSARSRSRSSSCCSCFGVARRSGVSRCCSALTAVFATIGLRRAAEPDRSRWTERLATSSC